MARYTDQQIRDKGFLYIPKQKYLQNPFEIQATNDDEVVTDQGIVNTDAFAGSGGDGDGFNAINFLTPDQVKEGYDPYRYRQAAEMNLIGSGDSQFDINKYGTGFRTKTEANKFMDMYPEYYRGDDDEEPTGIRSLISKGVNLIPGMGMLKTGARVLGGLFPTNYTSIMQNELAGQGIRVDDTGRIVGDRNTIEGVLAGKNASRVNEGTFDRQIGTLENTLGAGKYGLPQNVIDGIKSGEITDEELEATYGVKTELSQRLRNNVIAKDNFLDVITKSNIIYANENYDPSIETPVGADTITGPDINEDPNPDGPGYTGPPTKDYNPNVEVTGPDYGPHGGNGGQQNDGPNDGPGDTTDASGTEGEDQDRFRKDGGLMYARGGRVKYFYGGKV